MDYAGPSGIPYEDVFLSEWSEEDREHALAHQAHTRALCGGCGTHPADWDPERGGHPEAFVVGYHRCPGCLQLQSARRQLASQPEMHSEGVHVILVPNPEL